MKKNYTISIPVEKFWKRFLPITIILCAIGLVVAVFIVDRIIMPQIINVDKGIVTVPKLIALSLEDAREILYASGLRANIQSREYSNTIKRDFIISQSPKAGEAIDTRERRGVMIVVSKGSEVALVPNVDKLNEYQTRREILRSGFTVGKVYYRYHKETPKDEIVNLTPLSGQTTSREVPIDILVSKGPEPTSAQMPNVIGDILSAAQKQIEDAGLTVGAITTQKNSSAASGSIISQSIAPGSSVPFGNKVNLIVSATH
jgi:beta-lactam-binding protein with PASTA domain